MASRPLFLDFALLGFAPLVLVLLGLFFLPTESGAGDRAAFAPRPAEDPAASLKEKKRKGNRLGSSVVSGFGGRLSARAFVAHLAETAGASASDAERRSFRRIRKALFFPKTKQNSYLRFLLGKGGAAVVVPGVLGEGRFYALGFVLFLTEVSGGTELGLIVGGAGLRLCPFLFRNSRRPVCGVLCACLSGWVGPCCSCPRRWLVAGGGVSLCRGS